MSYILQNPALVLERLLEHLQMTGIALGGAVLISVPIAWIIYRWPGLQEPVMGLLGVIYTIPSLALMILLIPLFGLSSVTAIAQKGAIKILLPRQFGKTGVFSFITYD